MGQTAFFATQSVMYQYFAEAKRCQSLFSAFFRSLL